MMLNTESESVPAGSGSTPTPVGPPSVPGSGERHGWPLWWGWAAGLGALGAAVALVFASFQIHVPYYEFRPGSAVATAPLVEVADGVDAYESASRIGFTTVRLRQSTLGSRVLAWFDQDVQVIEEKLILGDRNEDENRQYNQQLMDTSKQDAVRVALLALGHEVPVSIDGVIVLDVVEDSPADGVLLPGETVVGIQGQQLDDPEDVDRIMGGTAPGDEITLSVESVDRSATRDVSLTLAPSPDDPGRGLIGVLLQARNPVYDFPFEVNIDSGSVGGPSAGLAFTLTVLDVLTPGELTGGLDVAVTGTIQPDGSVGDVGGVRQKMAAAIAAGYDVFLVPSAEFPEAAERAGGALDVIPVDTLEDALEALASLGGSGLGATDRRG